MKGVIVHGALLLLMLVYGYRTWTAEKPTNTSAGDVVLWTKAAADVQTVEYVTPKKTVKLTRKSEGGATYLWGIETKVDKKPKPTTPGADAGVAAKATADAGVKAPDPAGTDAGVAAAADAGVPAVEMETVTTSREFPVGTAAEDLLKAVAEMRAVRALPALTDETKKEYQLADAETTLTVVLAGGTKTFVIGGKVAGGTERYVLDPESGKGYILAGSLVDPLDGGEGKLGLKDAKGFDAAEVASVEVKAAGKTRLASRVTSKDDKGVQKKTWGDAATGKPDQTLANFIDNADKLKPTKFDAALARTELEELLSLTYKGEKGQTLGTVVLYKREEPGDLPTDGTVDPASPPPPKVEYYLYSEKTRVPGLVAKSSAERVANDVATLFAP